MKKQILIISYALLATGLNAAQPPREWGPEQATGAPNTPTAGDIPTAWASLHPDGGTEWLQVEFDKPVEVAEVLIRETFNPGAISKVVAIETDNKETIIWEGQAPSSAAPTEMVVKASSPVSSNKIKIYLDSNRVPGWNEIDAVQLVGKDGLRQWASIATASSSFAERPNAPQPVAAIQPHPAQQFNLQELLGNSLVDAQGRPVNPSTLKGKTIGLYFSAHWCGPCKAFTPKLIEFRNKIAKDFEVVFISSDRDETAMFNYMKESGMSWPALPFNSDKKGELSKLFQVRGIPSLVVLNDKGVLVSTTARNDVATLSPEEALKKWIKSPGTQAVNLTTPNNPAQKQEDSRNEMMMSTPVFQPAYAGAPLVIPADLTIDPGISIFGCPYGSTEKEVIEKLGPPIGKQSNKAGGSTLFYGADCALIFENGGLSGAKLDRTYDFLFGGHDMRYSSTKENYQTKEKTGGWKLANGVHHMMNIIDAKKLCGFESKEQDWEIVWEKNGQSIKFKLCQREKERFIHSMEIMPISNAKNLTSEYKTPYNIPCDPGKSIYGCNLGSSQADVIKRLGNPIAEFDLGETKRGLLYNEGNSLLLFWNDKLGGGIFSVDSNYMHDSIPLFPFSAKSRNRKNSEHVLPFTLNNGIGLMQPLPYAQGIIGDNPSESENGGMKSYKDGPSIITLSCIGYMDEEITKQTNKKKMHHVINKISISPTSVENK
jgi:thiol-disulfide isomerase/thioredoxin